MSKELRERFLPLEILNNCHLTDDEKFTQAFLYDMKKTAKFIFLAFENRDITLDVLNTLHEMMANVDSLLRKESIISGTYVVKSVRNGGMKMTLSSTLPTYAVTNISPNGMKLTLSKEGSLV